MSDALRFWTIRRKHDRRTAVGDRWRCCKVTVAHEPNYGWIVKVALKRRAVIVGVVLATVGCQTLAGGEDVSARITDPTDHSRAALQNAVNDALNTDVALADDALTASSVLIIVRNPPRNMQSPPAQGRNMDMPIRFRLVLNGSDCILIDQRDDSRYLLEKTTCAAE